MAYTRTYTIDAGPAGDTVKVALATKVNGDLTDIYTHLTTHEAMTTNAHGVGSGTVVGSATTETQVNKTLSAPTLTGTVTMSGATLTGGNSVNMTLATPTITGTIPASGATISGPAITGATITSSTLNGLTHTAATTGFTIAGGTTPATFTVEDTSLVNQDLTSDAGPTFDHLHIAGAGGVVANAANTPIVANNPTNIGVNCVGSPASAAFRINMTDNQTFTFTVDTGNLFIVNSPSDGYAGVFFAEYISNVITKISDPSTKFDITDVDNTKIAVFKGSSTNIISIKNYTNGDRLISVLALGQIISATAPA